MCDPSPTPFLFTIPNPNLLIGEKVRFEIKQTFDNSFAKLDIFLKQSKMSRELNQDGVQIGLKMKHKKFKLNSFVVERFVYNPRVKSVVEWGFFHIPLFLPPTYKSKSDIQLYNGAKHEREAQEVTSIAIEIEYVLKVRIRRPGNVPDMVGEYPVTIGYFRTQEPSGPSNRAFVPTAPEFNFDDEGSLNLDLELHEEALDQPPPRYSLLSLISRPFRGLGSRRSSCETLPPCYEEVTKP